MAEHITAEHNSQAVHGDGDHSHDGHGDTRKEYYKVFFFLLLMTALTVIAAKIPMPGKAGSIIHVTIGLIIAVLKVAAVIWIFMHIKFDNVYLRAMIFVPVFLFFVLTFALTVLGP
ncbi:MAG: cytochrome C oxidase subunit IV family protein [Bacteroidota bacterium]